MAQQFHGVIPPAVTPLTADQELDLPSFTRSINRMIDAGVNGIFTLGSSGEVAFSTDARREEIIRAAIDIVDGRVPVFVGCIDTETNRVIEHARQARELGASAIVATAPFYALGGMAEVERHFRLIHEAVPDLPLFAYDIPVCVHTKLPGDMLVRLGLDGVLAGVKDSSNDDVSFRFLVDDNNKAGHPLTLLTGQEVVVDGAYMAGADGSVPGLANVEATAYVRMWNAYRKGDWGSVRTEQDKMAALMRTPASYRVCRGSAPASAHSRRRSRCSASSIRTRCPIRSRRSPARTSNASPRCLRTADCRSLARRSK